MKTKPCARLDGEPREELRRRLHALGFDCVRFVSPDAGGATALQRWLGEGHHADMAWMERTAAKRSDPAQVLEGARSVVLLGVNYWPGTGFEKKREAHSTAPRWARYALHEDYHDTIKPGLVAAGKVIEELCGLSNADYRYYTDTGPLMERGLAARAGMGFRGKNGMLISCEHGNWLLLSAIITRAEIAPDQPLRPAASALRLAGDEPAGLLCGKCTRCLDACPTDAFAAPGIVNARRCISYQTIENKGIIPRELRAGIGARVFGCDVCLEVCPWNRFAQAGRQMLLVARHEIADVPLAELLAMTPERFATLFRRTAVKRLKLTGLLRNACIVAGNSGDRTHLAALVTLASHAAPLVRAHAVWAVRCLAPDGAEQFLAEARAAETEATVLEEYAASLSVR